MAGLGVRLGRIERRFPTRVQDGCRAVDFSALSDNDLDRLEELVGRQADVSDSERVELEALCVKVVWR
jgi:hypothetical protein